MNSNDLKNPIATPIILPVSIPTKHRDCKVILKDISLSCGAAKLQMLDLIQNEIHMTDSQHKTESHLLGHLSW